MIYILIKYQENRRTILIPSPTPPIRKLATVRARLAWGHFTGSKRALAARKNHTHTHQLDFKFLKKKPTNTRVFQKPYL